jgi:hypothetical protein
MESFSVLPDPRKHTGKVRHRLLDVVVMAVCAVIAGADNWIEVERFARAKEGWLSQFLDVSEGVPSHDTFSRVFSMIDVDRFADCFVDWVASLAELVDGRVVAIDGKTLRRSHDGEASSALHMVSAFCTSSGLVLGQRATSSSKCPTRLRESASDLRDSRSWP